MDFGDRHSLMEAEPEASADFNAFERAEVADRTELLALDVIALETPDLSSGNSARTGIALAVSSLVHAGALGLILFTSPPSVDRPEVLEIPIEVLAEADGPSPATSEPQLEAQQTAPEAVAPAELQQETRDATEQGSQPQVTVAEVEPEPIVADEPAAPIATLVPSPTESARDGAPSDMAPPVAAVLAPALPFRTQQPHAVAPKRVAPPPDEPHHPAPRRAPEERQRVPRAIAKQTARERPVETQRTATLPPRETSSPPAPSAVSIGAWRNSVAARIAGNKTYPESARSRGAAGTATVSLSIGSGGQLASASLSSSSGQADLDAAALSAVRRAAPFSPPPAGAPRAFSVPFRFGLR